MKRRLLLWLGYLIVAVGIILYLFVGLFETTYGNGP